MGVTIKPISPSLPLLPHTGNFDRGRHLVDKILLKAVSKSSKQIFTLCSLIGANCEKIKKVILLIVG